MFEKFIKLLFADKKFNQLPTEQYIKSLNDNLNEYGIS